MTIEDFVPRAKWTLDCQGKWDFDGPLISISCRYWPSGGGFHVLKDNNFELSVDPTIRPSATASIILRSEAPTDGDGGGDYIKILESTFEAETETEVKKAVENWVRAESLKIFKLLMENAA